MMDTFIARLEEEELRFACQGLALIGGEARRHLSHRQIRPIYATHTQSLAAQLLC